MNASLNINNKKGRRFADISTNKRFDSARLTTLPDKRRDSENLE